MIEVTRDLWSIDADVTVVTTNGVVRQGRAVMGRGCAREAAERFPQLPKKLAQHLQWYGNRVFFFPGYRLVTFPVKFHYEERADLALITHHATFLVQLADYYDWHQVACPRFGAGAGRLIWEDVKLAIQSMLDDRFLICHYPGTGRGLS